jgi:hypothetical protein
MSTSSLVYPQKRTFTGMSGVSALCHWATSVTTQSASLTDLLEFLKRRLSCFPGIVVTGKTLTKSSVVPQ